MSVRAETPCLCLRVTLQTNLNHLLILKTITIRLNPFHSEIFAMKLYVLSYTTEFIMINL